MNTSGAGGLYPSEACGLIVFAIRSERALCRDVRVNFAYRWFVGFKNKIPDHSACAWAQRAVPGQ
jgi:Transposase domain (DUF772)